jgi:DNA-binding transcriptional LysR family regulator
MQQIRCFCAALELGSFTAAADALRVSQPAVAEQVRKLEQALGADLFVRAGRGVVPTDAGRAFAEHAARSLRAAEDAADSVGELTAIRGGTIALGIFGDPAAWHVDELVTAFLRRHPGVSVRLVGRNSSEVVERVRRGELEAGGILLPIDDERLAGDTYLPSAYTRAPYYPAGLFTASFSPPLYDTFAIITRAGARLSPGVRELLADLEAHMRAIAERLDRSR